MRPRHVAAEAFNARQVLQSLRIPVGEDFHTLSRAQVDGLLVEANRVRYQRPAHANGSRARYFHDRLQRLARREN